MASEMVRVEILSPRDRELVTILTPAERRAVLVQAGQQKATRLAGGNNDVTQQQQTTDYTGWEIATGFLAGNLFGPVTDGIDLDASVKLYQQRLQEALEEAFPGATVRVDYQDAEGVLPASLQTRVYSPSASYQDDLRNEIELVEDIRNQVWDYAEGWVVYV